MKTEHPTKPYDLTFEVRDGYAYAYVAGEHDNFEICSAYWGEIGEKLTENRITKVMIVEDIAEESPLADVYDLASGLIDMGFRGVKIAFVDRYSSHQELNEFGVLVGSNRGLLGKAFSDEAEAEKWLLS
ncbi:MAG TPA: hypothetical protein VMZ26_12850 [Pyrinomonadaceae bacterium]|nr:hypothetical protein [Pyrinomonadaceae bacterium]